MSRAVESPLLLGPLTTLSGRCPLIKLRRPKKGVNYIVNVLIAETVRQFTRGLKIGAAHFSLYPPPHLNLNLVRCNALTEQERGISLLLPRSLSLLCF